MFRVTVVIVSDHEWVCFVKRIRTWLLIICAFHSLVKFGECIWERSSVWLSYTYIHTYIHTYIYIYIFKAVNSFKSWQESAQNMVKTWGSFTIPGQMGLLGPLRNTVHAWNSPSDFHLAFCIHVWIIMFNFHACSHSNNDTLEQLVTGRRLHKLHFRGTASPHTRTRTTQQLTASHQNQEDNKTRIRIVTVLSIWGMWWSGWLRQCAARFDSRWCHLNFSLT